MLRPSPLLRNMKREPMAPRSFRSLGGFPLTALCAAFFAVGTWEIGAASPPAPWLGAAKVLEAPFAGQDIPPKVKNDLLSKFEKDRANAVKKLAQIGGEEAWGLVLRALADRKGQVADVAQEMLASDHAHAEVWERMKGKEGLKHSDEWVRLRAAEVFGRLAGPVEAKPLVGVLSKKSPLASWAALRSLESLAARGALQWGKSASRGQAQASKACKGLLRMGGRVAGHAILALGEWDPEAARSAASKGMASKDPLVRAAALWTAFRLEMPSRMEWAAQAVQDEDAGLRGVAQRVLQRAGTKAALLLLVERLEAEPREKLLLELLPRLQAMTGHKAGRNPSAWRRYAQDLPSDWTALDGARDPYAEPAEPEEASRVQTMGLPTHSDRIVYLMDFSGSIWNEREGGKTRKELLDPIFDRTLDALQPETRFNLGPYTGEVKPWQPELVDADARKVKDAHRFIDDIKISGPGDFYLAVQWAKQDPEIDTICVLTDGAPSGGRRWEMGHMVDLLLEENRLRPIRYDVVLVDASKGLTRHWQRLTQETGGTVQSVQFEGQ